MNKEILGKYNLVLGLEIHVHVDTSKKMFCRCSTDIYNAKPNTVTCPICLGLPGALPVPNEEAVRKTQLLGMVFGCHLNENSKFDRKHYFYPDLPKGYQISQYKQPFCVGGKMLLTSGKEALLDRIHLEEDTAKSIHEGGKTLIDFNMSSMPLIEVVTKPIFEDIDEAVEFAKYVQKVVREYGVGEADMEKGQLRLEPNISLRTDEQRAKNELPKYKVEIKNINSFKFMEKAVLAEIKRQRELLEKGEMPIQENRGFTESTNSTVSQRTKENAQDYRYFPEPDIPPMEFDQAYFKELSKEFNALSKNTDSFKKLEILNSFEIGNELKNRAIEALTLEDIKKAKLIVAKASDAKKVLNTFINKKEIRDLTETQIITMLSEDNNKISDEDALGIAIDKVLKNNLDAVESYKSGKESALQFLLGMVMRETGGKADLSVAKNLLIEKVQR